MKTKSLLVTAFVLFAMGTSFAQSKKTMDMLKEKYGKDVIAYQHGKGSNSCYLIKMGYSGMVGICDKNGQIIVPMKYDYISLEGKGTKKEPFWFSVKLNNKYGVCEVTGKEIIPTKYDYIVRRGEGTKKEPFWYNVKLNNKEGACDATGKEIVPPVYYSVLYSDNVIKVKEDWLHKGYKSVGVGLNVDGTARGTYKPLPGYDENSLAIETQLKEKYKFICRLGDGTSEEPYYFVVKQNEKEGICDETGREVIPPKYDNVTRVGGYMWGNIRIPLWYVIKQNGKEGACNINGVEIIPPIYDNIKNKGFYYTEFNGKEIRINLNNPEAAAKNIYKDRLEAANKEKAIAKPATSPTPSKTPQTTSKSGNTNSQTTNKDGLLYSGTYTISGEVFLKEENRYIEKGKDEYLEIKIYKDFILVKNSSGEEKRYDFNHTINGWKVYQKIKLQGEFFTTHIYENYIVNSKFDVGRIDRYNYTDDDKVITYMIFMEKGRTKMPRHKNI